MTASVRILTTSTMDSSPSILLIAPDGSRILIDCGEGCQRSFLEYRERLSTVRAVCITHLSASALGGLPGMILTAADVQSSTAVAAAAAAAMQQQQQQQQLQQQQTKKEPNTSSSLSSTLAAEGEEVAQPPQKQQAAQRTVSVGGRNHIKKDPPFLNAVASAPASSATRRKRRNSAGPILESSSSSSSHGQSINNNNNNHHNATRGKKKKTEFSLNEQDLTVLGPVGMKHFMHALRHFVRRDDFHIQTCEGPVCELEIVGKQQQQLLLLQNSMNVNTKPTKKKTSKSSREDFMNFFITSLVFDAGQTCAAPSTFTPTAAAAGAHYVDPSSASPGPKRPRTDVETDTSATTTTTTATRASQTISYLFTTPPIPGKLQPEKAAALGVPKGPLFAQLKAGKTITFIHKETGMQQVVESHQVVTPPSPGIGVLILRYPLSTSQNSRSASSTKVDDQKNIHDDGDNHDEQCLALDRFFQSLQLPDLMRSEKQDKPNVQLELILHLCTRSDFESNAAVAWRKSLEALNGTSDAGSSNGDGNVVDVGSVIQHVLVDTQPQSDLTGSPHLGAAVMAQTRAILSSDIFLTLSSSSSSSSSLSSSAPITREKSSNEEMPVMVKENNFKCEVDSFDLMNGQGSRTCSEGENVVLARPTLEYILIPRSKRGLVQDRVNGNDVEQQEIEKAIEFANESGAKSLANSVLSECGDMTNCSSLSLPSFKSNSNNNPSAMGQLIFTGTASAIPCKYRNVTGMCLTDKFGRNMLLDIGEGTIGQLLRVHHHHHDNSVQSLLSSITAVWISHPHADHHLGILRLLEERQQQQQSTTMANGQYSSDPVVIIASPPIFDFLQEYSLIVPSIANSYRAVDCRDFLRSYRMQNNTDALAKLKSAFHVTGCRSVQVQHCPFSYAVILEGTSFGTLVYSGDCRPSHELAKQACGADVLIHEATFEDGMEAEAALKRHCTVGEALHVAQEMQAKCLVLTHFSQRYPKIPPTPAMFSNDGQETSPTLLSSIPIIFAFDFMRLTPRNLLAASKLTPALRLLYPVVSDDDDDMEEAVMDTGPSEAEQVLSVPGLFAQSNLL